MKLIVKEINRNTEHIEAIWNHQFENMERCLKFIQRLDGDLIKNHFKFEYTIREDD